jgi:hypothetical protein
MATTTTNFGWDIPQSTDLVKDGATAIAALGQDIDTAMVDLKGGTTGQVLAKASGTDLDFSWVAQDDSNAIQNAIVDAKGDLISATAADTPARLAVGTDGQILTVDSTTATGLKWSTVSSSPTFVGVSCIRSSGSQTASNATWTAVTWPSESFDTNGFHDNSTNTSRITIPTGKAGKYSVTGFMQWDENTSGTGRYLAIYKNGTSVFYTTTTPSIAYPCGYIFTTLDLSVGDYVEMFVYQDSGGTRTFYTATGSGNFTATYLGA